MSSKIILKNPDGSARMADLLWVYISYFGYFDIQKKDIYVFHHELIDETNIASLNLNISPGSDVTESSVLFIDKTVNMSRDIIRRKYRLAKNRNNADFAVVDASKIRKVYFNPELMYCFPTVNKVICLTGHVSFGTVDQLMKDSAIAQFVGKYDNKYYDLKKYEYDRYEGFDETLINSFVGIRPKRIVDINSIDMSIEGNDISIDNLEMLMAVKSKSHNVYSLKEIKDAQTQLTALAALNWKNRIGTVSRVLKYLQDSSSNYRKIIYCTSYQPVAIKNMIEVCDNDNNFANEEDLRLYQDWLAGIIGVNVDKAVSDVRSILRLMRSRSVSEDMFADAFESRVLLRRSEFKEKKDEDIQA